MSSRHRTAVRATLTAAFATALLLAGAVPAVAHGGHGDSGDRHKKRAAYTDGVSVPVVSSPNVRLVTTVPETQAIAGVFAVSAPYFYVSSLDSISVFDVRDPLNPRLTGTLPNLVFENEAMNYGERTIGGVVHRFVLVGVDLYQASPGDISHINPGGGNEVMVVDVIDPANPRIRSRAPISTSTHTVACIRQADCRYAYTAGNDGEASIVDLTNLDAPKELRTFASPAIGWGGHKWNFDQAGYGIHTGAGGAAMFDVRDPTQPRLVTTTDANGTAAGWNDFIHHNADRPNASRFTAGAAPSVQNGNVLLITEEDYNNTDCATAGSFQTWYVEKLDGTPKAIHPLDRINPVTLGTGLVLPHLAFCSAHWFDYHPSGIVAQGFYQGGLRLIDVRNPEDLKQYGYFASGLSEVWDAYWVPARNKNGMMTGQKTNIVYTADLVRGVDVFTVDLPRQGASPSPAAAGGTAGGAATTPGRPVGLGAEALLLTVVLGSVVLVRRRRARG